MERSVPMRKQDKKWLTEIRDRTDRHGGMYPGLQMDLVPQSVALRLARFIEPYSPHNPVHKDRWVITSQGRDALASQ
jgi:hypothetical protein